MAALSVAARDRNIVDLEIHKVRVADGGLEFFLEDRLAEVLRDTEFRGTPSDGPPPEAKLIKF